MPASNRSYSKLTKQALILMGQQIKLARKKRKMSEHDLAERAGIARSTLQKIEMGAPQIDIGFVFEAAILTGVPLFEPETTSLAPQIERIKDRLALMPTYIRKPKREVKDDF
ncbi:MAG: helix-turn-helix transcriptional regulator [Maricaulis sp.]|nr:helix-turn-helix transcriptional regulator [Maricaulis sp.]MDG2043402.1 helix-turn-helix transcriptional regulator [Maricaulis sp.]